VTQARLDADYGAKADTSEVNVVEPERDGAEPLSHVICPDCKGRVGSSKGGGHSLPDDAPADGFYGWFCDDCQNGMPLTCGGPDARRFNEKMVGVMVEFREGHERWVAVSKGAVNE
jgi:hypothetical protein